MTAPVRPGDPRRCEAHPGRAECTRKRKNGETCHGHAINGLDVCRMHAGMSGAVAVAKGQANLLGRAFGAISSDEYADPAEVLAWALTVTWLRAQWLASLVRGRLDAGATIDDDGLAGLVRLEAEERRETARVAKMAGDAGVSEAHLRLTERVTEQLVAVLRGVVVELGHDAGDPEVQQVVRRHLELVGSAAA